MQQNLSEIDKISNSFTNSTDLKLAIEQLSTEYKTNIIRFEEKQKELALLKLEKQKELHILAHLKEMNQ